MNLPSYLQSQGYVEVPLKKTAVGQIEVLARVNGEEALLLVDTGASGTVFDTASAERLHLVSTGAGEAAAGLGTSAQLTSASTVESLELGSLRVRSLVTRIVDMSHVNLVLQQRGARPCDGVLGADILVERSAVIDYRRFKLYLKEKPDAGDEG